MPAPLGLRLRLRRILPLAVALGVLLGAFTAASAQAGLLFTPCLEKDQQGFECATLRVPIDRSGAVPGTVDLRVERLIQAVQPARTLVNVEGGPGGSATWRSQQSARLFAPLRDRYQLVLIDPRGIGKSTPFLRCPSEAAKCARHLGGSARFYTTADNVADVESVRAELEADRLFVYGTSYGTYVAQQYARTHPDRTERIALDSPVGPDGIDHLQRATFGAIDPMLRRLCAGDACAGITTDLVRDVHRLAARLSARPMPALGVTAAGRREDARVDVFTLEGVLLQGDENVALRALLPAAVTAALAGDAAPLARLTRLGSERYTLRQLNPAIYDPTNCSDMRLPWRSSDDQAARRRAFVRAASRLDPRALGPFSRQQVADLAISHGCVDWPSTSLARAISTRPLPAVPTLILQGLGDLRTPPASARAIAAQVPGAQLMEVPSRAHGVLRTAVPCGQAALEAFVADRPVGNPCGATQPVLAPQPVPARGRPRAGAATRAAALATVRDALAVAQIRAPQGGKLRAGGLRGGTVRGTRLAGDRTAAATVRLERYELAPGTKLSGTVELRDGRIVSRVDVVVGRRTERVAFDEPVR